MIDVAMIQRWRATAETWGAKATALLGANFRSAIPDERWLVGYEAERYARAAIANVRELVPLLHEDQIEEVERAVRALKAELRDHRLSDMLACVEGRTPEEAAAVRAEGRGAETMTSDEREYVEALQRATLSAFGYSHDEDDCLAWLEADATVDQAVGWINHGCGPGDYAGSIEKDPDEAFA